MIRPAGPSTTRASANISKPCAVELLRPRRRDHRAISNSVLIPVIAQSGTFAVFMVLLVLTAGAVAALGEETRGRSLEEIAPEAEAA